MEIINSCVSSLMTLGRISLNQDTNVDVASLDLIISCDVSSPECRLTDFVSSLDYRSLKWTF